MHRILAAIIVFTPLLAGCGDSGEDPAATTARLAVTATAGPICPVETDPPSPECAPRPVEKAVIVVTGPDGTEVARGVTGEDGTVVIDVVPGELTVVPQEVEGLLGTAGEVTVTAVADETVPVAVGYDTGIR